MAKAKQKSESSSKVIKAKITRPGIHAKTKTSKSKTSKHYKKSYKGQGR